MDRADKDSADDCGAFGLEMRCALNTGVNEIGIKTCRKLLFIEYTAAIQKSIIDRAAVITSQKSQSLRS